MRPWLRGWVDEEPQTTVVWRTWLPNKSDAKAYFEAAPIETAETLKMERFFVLDWLIKRVEQVATLANDLQQDPKEAAGGLTAGDRRVGLMPVSVGQAHGLGDAGFDGRCEGLRILLGPALGALLLAEAVVLRQRGVRADLLWKTS